LKADNGTKVERKRNNQEYMEALSLSITFY
jgi:hypothetical protein